MNIRHSPVKSELEPSGSCSARGPSDERDSNYDAGMGLERPGRPATPVATENTAVSGGGCEPFWPGNSLPEGVNLCGTVLLGLIILCLTDFYFRNHPCPQAQSGFQKHLRIGVFGWANWWGNQVHSFGNNLRKLLAILTGCYLWPPRAVADETGRTLVRHKKTTTQNAT